MNKEKTELLYLWIEQDEHGCFQNMGFNFSSCYKIDFNQKTRELTAQKMDKLNVFSEPKIQNLTAIMGENGVGKTTMGEFAQGKINQWIDKIETGKLSEEEASKIIGLIGEPLIRRNVEKMVRQQYKKLEPMKGRKSIHSEITEEKEKMIDFLERQKAEIEKQIRMLRGM